MARFQQLLIILTIISLSNVHLALMQGITWVEMAVNSTSTDISFLSALSESVEVETKCDRCCELDKSHNQDQDRSLQWESKLVAAVFQTEALIAPNLRSIENFSPSLTIFHSISAAPETPPPRLV